MGVEHDAFAVLDARVVLKGATVESDLLTVCSDSGFIEVREHLELEDTFSDVGLRLEVDAEELSLEMALVGKVALQRLEKEGGSLRDTRVLDENLEDTLDRRLRVALSVPLSDHLGEVTGSLGVDLDDLAEDLEPIRLVLSLLAVGKDLVELVGLNKALDDFIGRASGLEDLKSHLRVVLTDQVTESVTHSELILVDPAINELGAAGLKDGSGKLKRLNLVEGCSTLKECGEVGHNGLLGGTRRGRQGLELVNGSLVAKKVAGGVASGAGSTSIVVASQRHVELLEEDFVGTWELEARGELEGDIAAVRDVLSIHNV